MSILRISWLPDGFYAPDKEGNLTITAPYNRRSCRGRMERYESFSRDYAQFVKPNDKLRHYVRRVIKTEASSLPKHASSEAPIAIFIHGFQFDPTTQVFAEPHHPEGNNPHGRLYHWKQLPEPIEMRAHSTSWPLGLGYVENDNGKNGLCIGFGWYSNPDFFGSLIHHHQNFYARAYNLANDAAQHLIALIEVLAEQCPNYPISLICHSLGSRVVIRALSKMAKERVLTGNIIDTKPRRPDLIALIDKVIILAGAEKVLEAQLMMARLNRPNHSDAVITKTPRFYNFVSRENDVLDVLAENFSPSGPGSQQVVGHNGLENVDPHWIDVQLDDPDTADFFSRYGEVENKKTGNMEAMRLMGDNEGVFAVGDHWIHFTWRHNMTLYRQILRDENSRWRHRELKRVAWAGRERFFDRSKLLRRHGTD